MGSNIVVHYFNGRQRGEVIRWILAYGGQKFTDDRIEPGTWFSDPVREKAKTPFGYLPYVEVDGEVLGQTHAIGRYFARKYGCAGQDFWEEAKVDEIIDYATDGYRLFGTWLRNAVILQDPNAETLKTKFLNADVIPYLKKFEQLVSGNGNGYIVGKGPTWADFTVVAFLDEVIMMMEQPKLLDRYPALKTYVDRVHNVKGVKEWLEKRPVTPF